MSALYGMPGLEPDFNRLNPPPTAPSLIGLSGYARTGKDTVAGIINRLYGHTVLSFSDILREFLYAQNLYLSNGKRLNVLVDAYGWEDTRERYPEIRDLQQLTGTEAARDILGQHVWTDAWLRRTSGFDVVNPSVRFPNEVTAIKSAGGKIFRVLRPGVTAVNAHVSDQGVDDLEYDDVIINDGSLTDLEGEVQRVLGEFE